VLTLAIFLSTPSSCFLNFPFTFKDFLPPSIIQASDGLCDSLWVAEGPRGRAAEGAVSLHGGAFANQPSHVFHNRQTTTRKWCSKCLQSWPGEDNAVCLAAEGSQDILKELIKLTLVVLQSTLKAEGEVPLDMNGFWIRVDTINLCASELLQTQPSPVVIMCM